MHVSWFGEQHRAGLVPLVQDVAGTRGAVGWLSVPAPEEVDAWLTGLLASGARLAVAVEGDRVLACGAWRRHDAVVLNAVAQIKKVMTHPDARGRGAGRAVVQALVDDARADGVEVLTLDCRGNNHGAQRLYAALGFVVTGRRPDVLAVGDERFDQVLMHLDLRTGPAGLCRHGSRNEGPGAT
ncbi:MAG: GCN5-related N-acetyltransferase [Frankiales bacterium]|nr:GCN5-related N-acetyltransferase [Frankiales bacterium]